MTRETRAADLDVIVSSIAPTIADNDFAGAMNLILQGQSIIAFIPITQRNASSIRFQNEILADLKRSVQMRLSTQISTVKVKHCSPTDGTAATSGVDSSSPATVAGGSLSYTS